MARYFLVLVAFILSACATGEVISDHSTRSVVYGWVDIEDISGNRMSNLVIRQYQPATEFAFHSVYFEKFAGGYIFSGNSFANGAYKLETIVLQSCLGPICTNTTNEYAFGRQGGGFGSVTIGAPGVHYLGSFKLTKGKSGFFGPGSFSFQRASNAPSRKQMLEFLTKNAVSEHAIYNQRILNAYNAL